MYKKMYYTLFNAATDAIAALEARDYGQASAIIKAAQQETEEQYINGSDEDDKKIESNLL